MYSSGDKVYSTKADLPFHGKFCQRSSKNFKIYITKSVSLNKLFLGTITLAMKTGKQWFSSIFLF